MQKIVFWGLDINKQGVKINSFVVTYPDDVPVVTGDDPCRPEKGPGFGLPDYREQTALHLGYSKISQIISGYMCPDVNKLQILDSNTPKEHNSLIPIGSLTIGDLNFIIFEGSGGHLYGEMIYVCREAGILFTGDILVNISGFSKERAEFNSLAPYLMKSVNVDSEKAREMRTQVMALIEEISKENMKPCIVCGGHGPVFEMFGDSGLAVALP